MCYAFIMPIMPIMPSKTSHLAVQEAIDRINFYCDQRGLSVNAFAKLVEVGQPTLCKFLNHQRVGIPKCAKKALQFIEESHNWHNSGGMHADLDGRRMIDEAARSIWDGSFESAVIVASLIQALGPAVDVVTKARSPKK